MLTRDDCLALDASDPLTGVRHRFRLPPDTTYLDGNSLGPVASGVREAVTTLLDQWGSRLIAGWSESGWLDMPARVGARLEGLLGAEPGSVICTDSTSLNLYKAVWAACTVTEGMLLTDRGNFPTDLYILHAVARAQERELLLVEPEELEAAIGPGVGVVSATHVDFRSGRRHDLGSITRRAHDAGALTLWDLSHSAGAMSIDLAHNGVDLAVGCGYKYLNGGPGAPAYLYVSPRWLPRLANPIPGWFAHRSPFDFAAEFVPAAGIDRMRTGTPDMLSMAAMEAALAVWEGVDLPAVREKSVQLTDLFIRLVDQELGERVEVMTPRVADERGSQVSLRADEAEGMMARLASAGVVGDFRPPDLLRFGLAPLYVRYIDVWDAVAHLALVA